MGDDAFTKTGQAGDGLQKWWLWEAGNWNLYWKSLASALRSRRRMAFRQKNVLYSIPVLFSDSKV